MVIRLADTGREIRLADDDAELLRYVYRPGDAQLESPRPYLHPVRTRAGHLVTGYRPDDHVWHKGISWALPNLGPANFWGGPTYLRGQGYRQLPNNGRMRHDGFSTAGVWEDVAELAEELTWITEQGAVWLREQRRIGARLLPGASAWALDFRTTLRNMRGASLQIGSPTTEGRDNAGYGGLFWRGPASFTGGQVVTPDGTGQDEYMGWRGPWLAFTGQQSTGPHGAPSHAATLVFRDVPGNIGHPVTWFVRSQPFACVCPAPFFATEYPLDDGAQITLRYQVAIADGGLTAGACAALATQLDAPDPPGGRA